MRIVKAAVASTPDGRQRDGRFAPGNTARGELRVLVGLDSTQAAEWLRPYLKLAERRFLGAYRSGLYRQTGSRLVGLLRAQVLAEAMHEALTAHAATLPVSEARPVLVEAQGYAREARAALAKLTSLLGVRKGKRAVSDDPLSDLARAVERDQQRGKRDADADEHEADEHDGDDDA
jgi:hypothetical protein